MAGVAANAALTASLDEYLRAGQLRGDRGGDDGIGEVEKGQVIGRLRSADGGGRMTAACLAGKIRAIEMGAENRRAAGTFGLETATGFKKAQMLLVTGDGSGRQQAGRPVASMGAADCAESLGCAVHKVGAGASVDVQIDEPRREIATVEIDNIRRRRDRCGSGANGGDPRVLHRYRTAMQQAIG